MNKIEWLIDNYLSVGDYQIPCVSNLADGFNQGSGKSKELKDEVDLKTFFMASF